jgi:hypothetical protein
MILSTYEEGNKSANVCVQQGQWVVMIYKNNQYLETLLATSETNAEIIAENYVMDVK